MANAIKQILFLLVFPTLVLATTTRVVYVDTDCTTNGDGTTSTCGTNGPYNSLANAESGEQGDLTSSDEIIDIKCSGTAADTSEPYFDSSWTTSSTQYVLIECDSAKDDGCNTTGVWSTSYYRISNSGYYAVVRINGPSKIKIENIQIENVASSSNPNGGIYMSGSTTCTDGCTVEGNIIRLNGTNTHSSQNIGIRPETTSNNTEFYFGNNLLYDWHNEGIRVYTNATTSASYYVYNNTIMDSDSKGLYVNCYGSTDTVKLRNNLIQNSTTSDYSIESSCSTFVHEKNITEDTTSPDSDCGSGGASSCASSAVTFENEASDNFHIANADTIAKDIGSDLSGDADYSFSTDFEGDTRSSPWDIGADEYVSTSPSVSISTILLTDGAI